jgi:DNA-binding XRE family transcriptional regulator
MEPATIARGTTALDGMIPSIAAVAVSRKKTRARIVMLAIGGKKERRTQKMNSESNITEISKKPRAGEMEVKTMTDSYVKTPQGWGQTLKLLRREAGMSQATLARLADMAPASVYNIEHIRHGMTVYTLEKILGALGYEIYIRKKQ